VITVSYELAQKMKKLGWEQKTEFYYLQSVKKEPRHRDNIVEFVDLDVFMSAPTADEIAEAINGDIEVARYNYEYEALWVYSVSTVGCGHTITEALGELWCKIQERKWFYR
jgi:hypothetical protein